MATVTATTTIKFADTLDITLLTPEQIAKFTDKDFAAFSTQQQVDLTAAQVALLTAKQIAALPLKLLELETVAAIDPKAISTLDIKDLSAEQFSVFTLAQMQAVTTAQMAALSTAQIDALTTDHGAVLTSAQIAALPSSSIKALSELVLETFSTSAIKGLTSANIIGLTSDAIKALTTDQAAALTADQIKVLKPNVVAEIEAEDLLVLTANALSGFTNKTIVSLDISALTPEQVAAFSPKQVAALTTTQLNALDETYAPVFISKTLAALSSGQIAALSTAIINTLEPASIKGLTVKNIKGLTADQLAAITEEQGATLSRSQLVALSATQAEALPSAVIVGLSAQALKSLPNALVARLSADAFASFSAEQIKGFSSKQISSLTAEQAAGLTSEHIEKFAPTTFKNLSASAISALSANALSGLTTAQISKLSSTQLEKMTPAQVTQFPEEIRTWAIAKGYATVQGAETDSSIQKGIVTSGSVTGTARAETITTGSAANTVTSTNSTAADNISTGAGADSITVAAPTTGAHTIDAGTGTDTLTFTDTAPTLTNVSGVETVVLAAGTQSFAIGAATNNDLATVTATALTAGQTLTLSSGTVDELTIALNAGNLTASAVSTNLTVTGGATANTVTTGSGDDSINVGAGTNSIDGSAGDDTITGGTDADTIIGGAGEDSITGGTAADTFKFSEIGTDAAPSGTVFDIITDFGTGSDIIDYTTTALTIQAVSTTPVAGTARISQTGLASFNSADNELGEKVTAVEAALTPASGKVVAFNHGSDGYIFISDGDNNVDAGDVLIKLEGDTAKGLVLDSDGNISSISGELASSTTFTGSDYVVMDTAAAIATALGTAASGNNLRAAIASGKIASITASDGNLIELTPALFAVSGVAALLDAGSVKLSGDITGTAVSVLTDNVAKIADEGLLSTLTNLSVDKDQFDTLADKFATSPAVSITLDATAATTDAHLVAIHDSIDNITSITNLNLLAIAGTLTAPIANALLAKATDANVVSTGHALADLITNKTHIADGDDTAGISTTIASMTATQFKDLGVKLKDGTVVSAVTVTTAEGSTPATVAQILAHIDNITAVDASGSGKVSVTDTEFLTLGTTGVNKFDASMLNVNASSANATELAAIVTDIGQVNSITSLALSLSSVSGTDANTLLGKATSATVVATGGESAEIGYLYTNRANIADGGISGTISLTSAQFKDLATKLDVTPASDSTVTVVVSGSTTALEKAAILANISKIDTLSGSGFTVTAAELQTAGFETLLNSSNVSVIVSATSATAANLELLSDTITNHPNVVSSITSLSLSTDADNATSGNAADSANDTITTNLLSKATAATVTATNATVTELTAITTYSENIGSLINSSNTFTAADFVAHYSSLPEDATIDATGATADQLRVIVDEISRVGSIKNLALNTTQQSAADLNTLLAKVDNSSLATVTATFGSTDASTFTNLISNVSKIQDGGISGVGLQLSAANFSALAAKFNSSINDLTVNASAITTSNADQETLAGISNYIGRVGLITNLTLDLGNANITNTVASNLLSRAGLESTAVTVTNATPTELSTVATYIDGVTTTGITGTLAIDSNVSATNITALFSKHPVATTATVSISGMSAAQLAAVDAATAKIIDDGVTGSVTNMDATQLTALASIDPAKLDSLSGVLALTSGVSSTDIGVLHTAYTGGAATATITSMSNAQLAALVVGLGDFASGGVSGSVTGMDTTQLTTLVGLASKITASTLTGDLVIDTNVSDANITTLFAKYGGTSATVDATGMVDDDLAAVAGGASKIATDGITNLTETVLILNDALITDSILTDLLEKSPALSVRLDAAGATAAEIAALQTNSGKLVNGNGILGTTTALEFTDTQFAALYSKLGSGKKVDVNAEGASTTELTTISTQKLKVDSLTNLTLTNTQTATEITNLLGLAATNTAKVSATSMDSTKLAAISAVAASKVATDGITGVMTVTATAGDATQIGALFTKYSGTTAAAVVTGMVAGQITALSTDKISTGGISGSVTGLDTTAIDALITKKVDISSASLTGTALLSNTQYTDLSAKLAANAGITASDTAQSAATLVAMDVATTGTVNATAATSISGTAADLKTVVITNVTATSTTITGDEALTVTDSGSVAATALSELNPGTTGAITAADVTTLTGTIAQIVAVTDDMTTGGAADEFVLAGLTTLVPSNALTATVLDNTVFTQNNLSITLANVAHTITPADIVLGTAITLKINGSGITTNTNVLTFDGSNEATAGASFSITGGAGSDVITGGAGADTFVGGAGNDIFNYVATADLIASNAVEDSINGGTGTDELKLTVPTALAVATGDFLSRIINVEKITAGSSAGTIDLTLSAAKLASTHFTAIDLSGDVDGTGANSITLSDGTNITTIIGSAGIDTITLGAGAPATTVTGGALADVFVFNNGSNAVVTLTDLSGTDSLEVAASTTVNATVTADWTAAAVANAGEIVITTAGFDVDMTAQTGTGTVSITNSGAAATLIGGLGADTIVGGANGDTITGGDGADSLTGAAGADIFNYDVALVSTTQSSVDKITDFGTGTDVFTLTGLTPANLRGAGTGYIEGDGTATQVLGTDIGFYLATNVVGSFTEANIYTALSGIADEVVSGDIFYAAISNGIDSVIIRITDVASAASLVPATDTMEYVVTLTGVDSTELAALAAANFAGFA